MKNKGIKRFFSAAIAVVLAVGLMPLPAFAETGSAQQEEAQFAVAGPAASASGLELTAQEFAWDGKEIVGLGTKGISNPEFANGGWSKVYFGSEGEPLLFNVLNTHETCFGGDTMFLDCPKTIKNMAPGVYGNEYFKHSNIHVYLNGEFLQQRFTGPEQDAIAYSVKGGQAPSDGAGWRSSTNEWASPFCPIDWRDYARIFILDAHEATNESYGFTNPGKTTAFYSDSFTRKKTGTTTAWWTRSKYEGIGYYYVTVLSTGQFSYQKYTGPAKGAIGVSPCLNVKLSSILYTSQVDTNTYKLTIKDNNIKVNVGDATDNLTWVNVPYTVTGDFSRFSFLLTDAEWTDSGWSNTDAEFIYLEGDRSVDSYTENSETGICGFKSKELVDHPGYNLYLIAERENSNHETDFASTPVKLTVKQNIGKIASGYTGTYDGKAHGISVDVTWPGSGATVKYGTAKGTYNLDASPTITNVADGPLDVYYQITADGYFTTTGRETVTILPANPTVPTGVTAYYGEKLGNASLPDGWSWGNGDVDVGGLGVKTFPASYDASTNSNFSSMSGVTIPVTVVERNHAWGDASYEWTFDNSSVTAKHSCTVCGIDETETASTSSGVTKQPTCSTMGETTYTAEFANTTFAKQTKTVADVPVNHDAHSWGDWTQTTAPTCEGEGAEERVCRLDGAHKETRAVAALGHNLVFLDKWSTDGGTFHERRKCDRDGCNYIVEFTYTTDSHVHSTPARQEAIAATCTKGGLVEHWVCSCGDLFNDSDCKDEHKVTAAEVIIPPLGHDMSDWVQTTAPTCSSMGESKRACGREGCNHEETRADAINPYAHEWGEWEQTTPPTCTKAGEDTRVCTHDSSHTEKRVGKPATGHVWIESVYEWADDNASVTATRVCRFDDGCEVETAAATSEVTQKPTCASKGKTTYTATFNNEGFTAQSKSIENVDIDPDAHEWGGWVATKYPTCTQVGTEERVCAHDPSHKESREIAIDPEAHEWGEWTVVKAPTGTEEGMEQRICQNDPSHVETRAIPAKTSIAKAKVTLAKTAYVYDGKAKKPKVKSVVLNGKKLKSGTDYKVRYTNNVKLGTATVAVTGVGNYAGVAKATFKITLGKTKASTAGNVGKKYVKVSWKKVAGAKKYQLQYRQPGSKWKTATVKGTSKTVKGLKAGGVYQFRVRAVAAKHKGAWSNVRLRYLGSVKGVKAMSRKAGSVTVAWEADSGANAGYIVVVRYEKGGEVAARADVAKGKTKATLKGLKAGKRLYVQVRPLRASGGKTYTGVYCSAWAKSKSAKKV